MLNGKPVLEWTIPSWPLVRCSGDTCRGRRWSQRWELRSPGDDKDSDDFDCDDDGDDDSDGDGDGYPLHEEHAAKAEEAAEEGNPGVEILERRTPPFEKELTFFVWLCHLKTWALGDACMERGEVDECIGGDKEVWQKSAVNLELEWIIVLYTKTVS